jgi:flagellar export protein FliJ
MLHFRFRLERVLSWRRTELQAEETRLASLVAERNRLEAARDQVREARDRAGRELLVAGSADGSELASLAGYRARLDREQAAIEHQRIECLEKIAGQRARVLEAHRRVRLLDKLRGRRLEEWHTAWQRELESFASETFLARWRRG